MNTNSDTTHALYLGLDVHKEQTTIAILESHREAQPRTYGNIATTQHALERAMRRIAKLEDEMLQLLDDWPRKPLVKALMAFKGFKLVAAMVMVSETGTFSRFEHPKKYMAFLGLVPSESSSGNSRKQGGISKCGNPHARWLLVEQATHYRVPPKVSAQLSERQRGMPHWIRALSWKTQTRLSHRFSSLRKRQMHHNKIKVTIARELAGFLWELGTRFESKQTVI